VGRPLRQRHLEFQPVRISVLPGTAFSTASVFVRARDVAGTGPFRFFNSLWSIALSSAAIFQTQGSALLFVWLGKCLDGFEVGNAKS
jgi:hypothetical protein